MATRIRLVKVKLSDYIKKWFKEAHNLDVDEAFMAKYNDNTDIGGGTYRYFLLDGSCHSGEPQPNDNKIIEEMFITKDAFRKLEMEFMDSNKNFNYPEEVEYDEKLDKPVEGDKKEV